MLTTGDFTVDEVGFIGIALTRVLSAVAHGKLDLNLLAREELAARGLNDDGVFIGFKRAEELLKEYKQEKQLAKLKSEEQLKEYEQLKLLAEQNSESLLKSQDVKEGAKKPKSPGDRKAKKRKL